MTWMLQRVVTIAFNIVLLVLAWHYRYEIKAFVIQAIHFFTTNFVTKP